MKKSWGLMNKILGGQKKIESRWFSVKHKPWDNIKKDEIVYFKNSGEPVKIKAEVTKVMQFSDLTPNKVEEILDEYGRDDGIEKEKTPEFFERFKDKKYCLLIFLKNPQEVKPFKIEKIGFGSMSAWIMVDNVSMIRKMSPIIVALDGISSARALQIAKSLKGLVWGFKVNDLLFDDSKIIRKLKKYGRVFADAKLYDIPNIVSSSVARFSAAGADLITVHASGGVELMRAAKKSAGKSKILAVTVLTSSKESSSSKLVLKLAKDSIIANIDGVVCSGHELTALKKLGGLASKLKVVPGIRPEWYSTNDDQQRIITPAKAIRLGADLLVIGRPIVRSSNPRKALKRILSDIE